jgi:hypothetical protein
MFEETLAQAPQQDEVGAGNDFDENFPDEKLFADGCQSQQGLGTFGDRDFV